ncbi:MAG: hypothetical protein M0009_04725 [Deltaproteobacteria bacterium]|nr:hypothetical protein [Deltaproteobacteria bacterium]
MRILTVMMVLLLACAAYGAEPRLGTLDRDKSGTVEQTEIEKGAPAVFKKADKTKDRSLDRKEFEKAGGTPLRFDEIDKDKNGRIDIDEFRAAAIERFKQYDVNRDGRIDRQELRSRQAPIENPQLLFFF